MNNVRTRGAIYGTYSIEKRRILLLFLAMSLICFSAGDIFLPNPALAAGTKISAKSTSKETVKKIASKKSLRKKSATKKSRGVFVRSIASKAERTALLERGISSGFGLRAISRKRTRMHNGIDIPAPRGSKVLAYNDGEVIFAGVKNGYGKTVIIHQIDGREALYAHMNKYFVFVGDKLRRGHQVGEVGRTGRTTGFHLHFEIIDEGENLDPALHVWHGSELVLGPGDLDPDASGQTQVASPDTGRNISLN